MEYYNIGVMNNHKFNRLMRELEEQVHIDNPELMVQKVHVLGQIDLLKKITAIVNKDLYLGEQNEVIMNINEELDKMGVSLHSKKRELKDFVRLKQNYKNS